MAEFKEDPVTESDRELVQFVTTQCDLWREHRDTNYEDQWDEYERLYYGIWSDEDKTRESERSKIVSPAIRQAVENKTSEIMEATTGRGEFFELKDNAVDETGTETDVELVKKQLHEDLKKTKADKTWAEINRNAEVFGLGIAEIQVKTQVELIPSMQPLPNGQGAAIGVNEVDRVVVPVKSVHPRNFLWDPNSDNVDDALGVAIEEYTSLFKVVQGIESGIYRKVNIGPEYSDNALEPNQLDTLYENDKVRILRYYGLVPREYLEQLENEGGEVADLFPEDSDADKYSDLVEAVIVIGNGQYLLKAEANPYMMKDRPVVTYTPEKVAGRLVGMGTVQKGYNMQKAIDAQLRSHLDSLALTTAPMMAGASMSLAMSSIIKKNKQALINFQDDFLIPLIRKVAVRYMQFDPERYPSKDFTFVPASTLGMVAREYEQQQFIGLLQTLGPDSPVLPLVLKGIIKGSSLSNKEELASALDQMLQPNPEQQQMAQMQQQAQIALLQAQIAELQGKAQESQANAQESLAKAQKTAVETQLMPEKLRVDVLQAASNNLDGSTQGEFERRVKVADLILKEREIQTKENIVEAQMKRKVQ